MPHPLWRGAISFGLVTIPVSLYPARSPKVELAFKTLDRMHLQPVHERRLDIEEKEVPYEDTVKGYEYEKDQFVVVTPQDFETANVEATQSIDIIHFVDAGQIDPVYYDKPYYVEPQKAGRKAYALLREVLKSSDKVGVGRIVIRTRQHMCALRASGPLIVAHLLRWSYELRRQEEFDLPEENLDKLGISPQELQMAQQLVEAMVAEWEPEQYRDTYREDLLQLIEEKVRRGELTESLPAAPKRKERGAEVVDIMSLLKRSMEQKKQGGGGAGKSGAKSAARAGGEEAAKGGAAAKKGSAEGRRARKSA